MAITTLARSAGPAPNVGSSPRLPVLHAEGTSLVVVLRGETDISGRPFLCRVLSGVIAFGVGDVVVDLADVTFVDTAAVRVFSTAAQLLEHDGRQLTFRSPSRLAVRVLDMFGLTGRVEIEQPVQP